MAGFHIYHSNRMEKLVDCLAEIVSIPSGDPLVPEIIIIQSQGMERWLNRELSKRLGVWANPYFPFPKKFTEDILRHVFPDRPNSTQFNPEMMAWRLMSILVKERQLKLFEPLWNYLGEDRDCLKLFQLSLKIARLFDQYLVYRPAMLMDWEAGREEDWQAGLWRRLTSGTPEFHRAAVFSKFLGLAQVGGLSLPGLPGRASLFGISSLPPLYLQFFSALANEMDVYLFFLNPCQEYWGDQISEKEKARQLKQRGADRLKLEEEYFRTSNSLLASWGKSGREYLNLLIDQGASSDDSLFEEPGGGSLLQALQSDLLHLRELSMEIPRRKLSECDRSLQIHSCHSPLREMEVLQDHLWEMFEQLPGLAPQDILVVTPDIETYAPYIHAVFGGGRPDKTRIPYTVADRQSRQESPVIAAFLKILELAQGRFEASAVLSLLDFSTIRRQFSLEAGDLEKIYRWIRETGIRWGFDAADRKRSGVPAFAENSWQFGLQRLFLGFTLQGNGEKLFEQILPFDDLEGGQSLLLGRFAEFIQELFETVRGLERQRRLREWDVELSRILGHFFAPDDQLETEYQMIRSALEDLSRFQEECSVEIPIDLRTVRHYLERTLEARSLGRLFLSGGITFCALLPMRSIPSRVIAMVGLNHDTYPRSRRPPEFDLMAIAPQPGDRSLRDEDRGLFLETLISARERLYLSYCGQNPRDNSEAPPSVCIDELLDYIRRNFDPPDGSPSTDAYLRVRHRLQPFSPVYFSGLPPFFSYSEENCQALQARASTIWQPVPFMTRPLEDPGPEWKFLQIEDCLRFFRGPAEYFLKNRLGIDLRQEGELLEDREPFELDGLEEYALKAQLLEEAPETGDYEHLFSLIRQQGLLPVGAPGHVALGKIRQKVTFLKARVKRYQDVPALPPLEIDMELNGFKIVGRLPNCWKSGRLRYRPASIKVKDRLSAWIEHLLLNCLAPVDYPRHSILIGEDEELCYLPVSDPRLLLISLLGWYWRGLRLPLHFFPESSLKFMKAAKEGKSEEAALSTARERWEKGSFRQEAERDSPYNHLAFGESDPLDKEFIQASEEIFGPLMEHEGKGPA